MVQMKFLRHAWMTKVFLEALQLLVNKILNESKYPTSWNTELIRPIHKKEETYLEKTTGVLVLFHVQVNSLTIYSK